ncbi:hypothetical protein [Aquimarina sp. RZ0]|uniref:hypothetical protein n=1 Tax=Aquimarina sp. RZ0 TaxID=2607730 RepID=UPI0011F2DFD4|nr:hypothetical protein [Aquimarina sp. RZ0]KAA1240785.1 hypothetical protein F0000_26860 [Aquimarina sp. RZ0]
MRKEIINTWNGEKVELNISSDGYCFCPVCGIKSEDKKWRPYDENGHPSYDICSCGFEYGFDEGGEPPYEKSWSNYREKWLNNEIEQHFGKKMTKLEKLVQLKNIEIE